MIEVKDRVTGDNEIRTRYHLSKLAATAVAYGLMKRGEETTLSMYDLDDPDAHLDSPEEIMLAGVMVFVSREL